MSLNAPFGHGLMTWEVCENVDFQDIHPIHKSRIRGSEPGNLCFRPLPRGGGPLDSVPHALDQVKSAYRAAPGDPDPSGDFQHSNFSAKKGEITAFVFGFGLGGFCLCFFVHFRGCIFFLQTAVNGHKLRWFKMTDVNNHSSGGCKFESEVSAELVPELVLKENLFRASPSFSCWQPYPQLVDRLLQLLSSSS